MGRRCGLCSGRREQEAQLCKASRQFYGFILHRYIIEPRSPAGDSMLANYMPLSKLVFFRNTYCKVRMYRE
jgi:hypothetical protein